MYGPHFLSSMALFFFNSMQLFSTFFNFKNLYLFGTAFFLNFEESTKCLRNFLFKRTFTLNVNTFNKIELWTFSILKHY